MSCTEDFVQPRKTIYASPIYVYKYLKKTQLALYSLIVIVIVFAGLTIYLSTRPPAAGCKRSLEMSTEGKFTFSQECIDEISNAAKEATLKTGATEEVANTASEAAAEAARNTFESGTSPTTIARGIANDTFNVIAEEAAAQGENMTEATIAASAAGAAAAIASLGASSPDAAEFAASVSNASFSDTTG
jgi:hypothetical protein